MLNIIEVDEKDELQSPFRPFENDHQFGEPKSVLSASKFLNKPSRYVGRSPSKAF